MIEKRTQTVRMIFMDDPSYEKVITLDNFFSH